ncbi:MAG: ribosome assembly cofactor RimP [Bacteroidales bacterium]|nr:ribosome assembly cofactor RimP [Bacteroidales bacterium]MBP5316401.1 ribosome assembly cofactor RimP [Bacteroidales bacterium]
MKQKEQLEKAAADYVEGKDLFIVDIKVSADNDIDITIETDSRDVTLDDCVEMSRFVESRLDRDVEDFSLTVGSAGLTAPFRIPRQYRKFVGSTIEVTFRDGHRQKALLESADDESFDISYERLVPVEGKKKKVRESVRETLKYADIKSAKAVIKF